MKRKQLTKAELIAQAKALRKYEQTATNAPFYVIAVLFNYVLWKTEKWGQKRLIDFNTRVAEYYCKCDDEDLKKLAERVSQKSEELTVRAYYHTSYMKGSSYYAAVENRIRDIDNSYIYIKQKYITIALNVLMDLGYGEKRLNRVNDAMWAKLRESENQTGSTDEMREELKDYAGVCIEKPEI